MDHKKEVSSGPWNVGVGVKGEAMLLPCTVNVSNHREISCLGKFSALLIAML